MDDNFAGSPVWRQAVGMHGFSEFKHADHDHMEWGLLAGRSDSALLAEQITARAGPSGAGGSSPAAAPAPAAEAAGRRSKRTRGAQAGAAATAATTAAASQGGVTRGGRPTGSRGNLKSRFFPMQGLPFISQSSQRMHKYGYQ